MTQEGQQQLKQGQVEGALIQEGQPLPLDQLHFQMLGEDNKPQVHERHVASYFTETDTSQRCTTRCCCAY